jgi:hypothetical protein
MDEFGDSRPSLWGQVILPTLVDRRGWAVFIGTPKGKNHFFDIHTRAVEDDAWFTMTLRASDSGIVPAAELAEIRTQMEESEYLQEFECDFTAAVKGTYYSHIIAEMELGERIGETAHYDPTRKVKVAMDIGRIDATTAWFWQDSPSGPMVIDYEEHEGKDVDYFADLFKAKGYDYEEVWVPHDAKAKTFATKRSTIEQFMDYDFPAMMVPKLSVQDGISAVRKILPICHINAAKCKDGIEALRAYKKKYNELTKSFSNTPQHDWASNGADGFRYLSLVCKASEEAQKKPDEVVPILKPPSYTLNGLFEANESKSHRFQKLRIG